MSNSPLVSYTRLSPNRSSPRNHKIDTITVHCVVGQLSVETIGSIFADPNRQASSNYAVGADGRIGMYVEEKDRSWASSNRENDNRAITIETACDRTAPYAVTETVYNALIELLVDICKRNGIPKLLWSADPTAIGRPEIQNMTAHRWFAPTECPGDWLYRKMGVIANEVNAQLEGGGNKPEPEPDDKTIFRVQVGAFRQRANAERLRDELVGKGYEGSFIVKGEYNG